MSGKEYSLEIKNSQQRYIHPRLSPHLLDLRLVSLKHERRRGSQGLSAGGEARDEPTQFERPHLMRRKAKLAEVPFTTPPRLTTYPRGFRIDLSYRNFNPEIPDPSLSVVKSVRSITGDVRGSYVPESEGDSVRQAGDTTPHLSKNSAAGRELAPTEGRPNLASPLPAEARAAEFITQESIRLARFFKTKAVQLLSAIMSMVGGVSRGRIMHDLSAGARDESSLWAGTASAPFAFLKEKEARVFIGIACALLLAVNGADAMSSLSVVRWRVLGEATQGMQALVAAHDSFVRNDTDGALDNFLAAQGKFAKVAETLNTLPLAPLAKNIPSVHTGMRLVEVGDAASQAAEHALLAMQALDSARRFLESEAQSNDEPFSFSISTAPLIAGAMHMQEASLALRSARTASEEIEVERIPPEYRPAAIALFQVIPPAERLAAKSATGLSLLAGFLGAQSPRRLAVVFQNDAELRPTGGFMGSFAYVDTANGSLRSLEVPGGGLYDLKGSMRVQVEAPYQFHLLSPFWSPWNANAFFDFPASAEAIAWFIEKAQGPTVDGIIAVTPAVVEGILGLSSPVFLPDYGAVITDKNVRRVLQEEVEVNYRPAQRRPKQIIGDMIPAILSRIQDLVRERPQELFSLIARALDRKDLLLWSALAAEQERIRASGWGGAVEGDGGDYLAVVHTNVGGGKTDRVIEESWKRVVTFLPAGGAQVTLTITRAHHGDPNDRFEKVHNVDYVRIFVPDGSKLQGGSGFNAPDYAIFKHAEGLAQYPLLAAIESTAELDEDTGIRVTREHGRTVFGGWLQTGVGDVSIATVTYLLPPAVIRSEGSVAAHTAKRVYTLTVQRQPGAGLVPFVDTIVAPAEWGNPVLGEANSREDRDDMVVTSLTIDRDTRYEVRWER